MDEIRPEFNSLIPQKSPMQTAVLKARLPNLADVYLPQGEVECLRVVQGVNENDLVPIVSWNLNDFFCSVIDLVDKCKPPFSIFRSNTRNFGGLLVDTDLKIPL